MESVILWIGFVAMFIAGVSLLAILAWFAADLVVRAIAAWYGAAYVAEAVVTYKRTHPPTGAAAWSIWAVPKAPPPDTENEP